MNILFIISRTRNWTPYNYVRKGINFTVGIGLCLMSLMTLNEEMAANFGTTPWPLPTLLLAFFFILILNHLPHPPPLLFAKKRQRRNAEAWEGVREMGFRNSPPQQTSGAANVQKEGQRYHDLAVDGNGGTAYLGGGR